MSGNAFKPNTNKNPHSVISVAMVAGKTVTTTKGRTLNPGNAKKSSFGK